MFKLNPLTGTLDLVGSSGSGTTPGGSSGDVQFNNGLGGFGGESNLNWNSSGQELDVTSIINIKFGISSPKLLLSDDILTAALVTEVDGQLIDYGSNYGQSGVLNTSYPGGFFRIDLRDMYTTEFFNLKYVPIGESENTIFGVTTEGQVWTASRFLVNKNTNEIAPFIDVDDGTTSLQVFGSGKYYDNSIGGTNSYVSGINTENSYLNSLGGSVGIKTTSSFDALVVNGGIHSISNATADQDSEFFFDFIPGYQAGRFIAVSDGTKYPTFTFECHWNAAESMPQYIPLMIETNTEGIPSVGVNQFNPTALFSINDRNLTTSLPSFDIYDNDGSEYAIQVWSSGGRYIGFGGDANVGFGNHVLLNYDNPSLSFIDGNIGDPNILLSGDSSQDSYLCALGGNLGVGTPSPSRTLDINGTTRFRGAIYDQTNSAGSTDDILSNNGSGGQWKSPFSAKISQVVTTVSLTNQAADITSTNFSNTSFVGLYRVSYSLEDTTTAIGAGAVTLTIGYTDDAGSATQVSAAQILTTAGRTQGTIFIQNSSATAITYSTTHTGIFSTAKYALYITVERLK